MAPRPDRKHFKSDLKLGKQSPWASKNVDRILKTQTRF